MHTHFWLDLGVALLSLAAIYGVELRVRYLNRVREQSNGQ